MSGERPCKWHLFSPLCGLSGVLSRLGPGGHRRRSSVKDLTLLFVWISLMHLAAAWRYQGGALVIIVALFRASKQPGVRLRFPVLHLILTQASCTPTTPTPRVPASSPAAHLTFRPLPGLKPEPVCFRLSVCWRQRWGDRNLWQTTTDRPPHLHTY